MSRTKLLEGFIPVFRRSKRFVSRWERPTIFQLSSGAAKSGVAVVRVSGEAACKIPFLMTKNYKKLEAKKMVLSKILHPSTKEVLDKGFVVWFPRPNSFTGEDMIELHTHGGPAVIKAVLSGLGTIENYRPAEPGEFTKRAFFNGKLDLTEVEGLADLLNAETEAQRRQALKQMDGALGKLYLSWKEKLVQCLAQIEAYIDFGEEENVEDALNLVISGLKTIQAELAEHLSNASKGQRLRSGVRAAIIGKPNVGKSSLLNAVCGEDLSIISPVAGTTRDVVESTLNIGGYPLIISDTAGIRQDTDDPVEIEGVRRALKRSKEADLIVAVHDVSTGDTSDLKEMKERALALLSDHPQRPDVKTIFVLNKCDQLEVAEKNDIARQASAIPDFCLVSCLTGEGLEGLSRLMLQKLVELCANPLEESASLTQERHRFHVQACFYRLNKCSELVDDNVVFAAEELRQAVRSLGKITGKITTEEVLDVIFKDFCIGK